jgi:enamine deaminase RidA (YjgF/YER057c/UK114 family)
MANPNVRFTNPAALPKPTGYSHVAEVSGGRIVYISGQVPLDANGNLVGSGDLGAQTTQVFHNLKHALQSVGADFPSVVKLGFYLLDISQVAVVREVRDQFLDPHNPPTSTALQVSGLVRKEFLIEIDAVAVVP